MFKYITSAALKLLAAEGRQFLDRRGNPLTNPREAIPPEKYHVHP
jgi:hypothetical protein